jgi:hypothetical protein
MTSWGFILLYFYFKKFIRNKLRVHLDKTFLNYWPLPWFLGSMFTRSMMTLTGSDLSLNWTIIAYWKHKESFFFLCYFFWVLEYIHGFKGSFLNKLIMKRNSDTMRCSVWLKCSNKFHSNMLACLPSMSRIIITYYFFINYFYLLIYAMTVRHCCHFK